MLGTMFKEANMSTRKLVLIAGAIALAGVLGGCASAGSGSSSPYGGPHNHQRDAKQGPAPSAVTPGAPSTRKSLRPAA
jgi:hypothetical protein